MSLDLYLIHKTCEHCGLSEETKHFNYTYNVSPMWYAIFPDAKGMVDIDDMSGGDALLRLNIALLALKSDPDKFIKLNPPNGWGSYDRFIEFIEDLIVACNDNPNSIWGAGR